MPKNVLYLGMAFDIMTPLFLCPDLDTLFTVDYFDDTYGYHHKYNRGDAKFDATFKNGEATIDSLKYEVVTTLEHGNDKTSVDAFVYPENKVISLKGGKARILENTTLPDGTWVLKFLYAGKARTLKRFEGDFHEKWPEEIKDLAWIIGPGSKVFEQSADGKSCEDTPPSFVKQMVERSLPDAKVAVLEFNHQGWDSVVDVPRRSDEGLNIMKNSVMSVKKVAKMCGYVQEGAKRTRRTRRLRRKTSKKRKASS